jgi:flagellar biosynthetic protein FlhB
VAEKPASERTEQPTRDRLRRARKEGQIPQGQELPSALMFGTLLVTLCLAGPPLLGWCDRQVRLGLSTAVGCQAPAALLPRTLATQAGSLIIAPLPFLIGGAAMSVLASLATGGWTFAPSHLNPKFDRISPAQGFKNLFSSQSVMRLLTSVAKLAVLGVICWTYVENRMDWALTLRFAEPAGAIAAIASFLLGLMVRIAVALAVIAIADTLYQRWKYRRDLRMTRQEVKEEVREHELSPQLRGRIKSMQMAMARKRMMQEVPKADVVVTNPTHVAVALRYDAGQMDAPVVIAKGADLLAGRIRDLARTHDVPVVERPQLARTLYATVQVGEAIPEALFVSVAEILAMIYRLRKRRSTGGAPAR